MNKSVKKFLIVFLIAAAITALSMVLIFVGAVFGLWGNIDDVDVNALKLKNNSKIVYIDPDTGEEKNLLTLSADEKRIWVDLDATPKNLQNAIIAIEDERFFKHKGVDLRRTTKATVTYIIDKITGKSGSASLGGSTITQQLIKNITGDKDQTAARKILEISRSVSLEKQLSKNEILELYMNCIYLSQGYGVQIASNLFFDKDVSALNLAECAAIAGITQNPVLYDPSVNPEKNKERQEVVLGKMLELGYITQEEYDEAKNYKLKIFNPKRYDEEENKVTSYYTDQVVLDVLRDLQAIGYSEAMAHKLVYSGGLKITAAYNPKIQSIVDKYFSNANNFADPKAQSSIVVLDPYTGQVVGIAGGIGKKEGRLTLNRASQSPRQPGSSIKPIAVYAPAIDAGIINSGSTFEDVKKSYNGWSPRNNDYNYRGLVSLNYAVQASLNTVAVEVLSRLGFQTSYDFLTDKLGFSYLVSEEKQDNGDIYTDLGYPQLALGGLTHGVTALEMASAYAIFANDGIYNKPYTYTTVVDSEGKEILNSRNSSSTYEVIKPSTAYVMTQLLLGVVNNGTGRGAGIGGIQTAGKTGTTTNNFDRWFVGYTPNYVAAVWYGYDTPKEIYSSANPCVPTFRNIMSSIHSNLGNYKSFNIPDNMVRCSYCTESGLLPGENCPVASSYFMPGTTPTRYCTLEHEPLEPEEDEENAEDSENSENSGTSSENAKPSTSDNDDSDE